MDRREFLLAQVAAAVTPARGQLGRSAPRGFPVALWLAPIVEQRRRIQEEINQLSQEHRKLPIFRAHATLASGFIPDLGEALYKLLDTVDRFCKDRQRMSLAVVKGHECIGHRDKNDRDDPAEKQKSAWSTFLFLALQPGGLFTEAEKGFNKCNLKAKRDPDDTSGTSFLPHFSLAYCDPTDVGDVDRETIEERLRSSLCSLEQVTFEAVEVVVPESGNWNDIISAKQDRWNVVYARQFEPPKYHGLRCVVAGGQVGIDQTALEAAQAIRVLATGGWCPPKRETQPDLPPIPDKLPLKETPERDSTNALGRGAGAGPGGPESVPRSLRTEWNCRDSDGTLLVAASSGGDVGTIWTVRFAHDFKKPICSCKVFLPPGQEREKEINRVLAWLQEHNVEVLNVAGPAKLDSVQQGIAKDFFLNLFKRATP